MSDDTQPKYDLTPILSNWPFEPGTINVRVIEGIDKLPKLQVRLDLGIIQMNIDGRPDGQRPNGFSSLLEYVETRIDEAQEFGPEPVGDDDGSFAIDSAGEPPLTDPDDQADTDPGETSITIDPETCRALREEAAQYYHRYVALLVLEDFEGVIRDTSRNLRVADVCRDYAEDVHDREMLDQVRPYILMMRTRAVAGQALKDEVPKAAVAAVDRGLEALKDHFESMNEPEGYDQSNEAQSLREMRDALVPKLPVSQKTELRDRLHEAVKRENYELAAILRNELRMLGE
jgi:hypothetical protein